MISCKFAVVPLPFHCENSALALPFLPGYITTSTTSTSTTRISRTMTPAMISLGRRVLGELFWKGILMDVSEEQPQLLLWLLWSLANEWLSEFTLGHLLPLSLCFSSEHSLYTKVKRWLRAAQVTLCSQTAPESRSNNTTLSIYQTICPRFHKNDGGVPQLLFSKHSPLHCACSSLSCEGSLLLPGRLFIPHPLEQCRKTTLQNENEVSNAVWSLYNSPFTFPVFVFWKASP